MKQTGNIQCTVTVETACQVLKKLHMVQPLCSRSLREMKAHVHTETYLFTRVCSSLTAASPN